MKCTRRPLNPWSAFFATSGILCAGLTARQADPIPILIAGDVQGYLAPCGCTSPMTGGIRRLATAVAQNRGSDGVFLVNGGLVDAQPPNGQVGIKQNELKLQTLAEAFAAMKVDAINLGKEEASSGRGSLIELSQLSGGRAISTSLAQSQSNTIPRWEDHGPLLIGGVTPAAAALGDAANETGVDQSAAIGDFVAEARSRGMVAILMYRGGLDAATTIAKSFPQLSLIVYQSGGTAPEGPLRVGSTLLVTPGDHTKNLVRLELKDGKLSEYHVFTLSPAYADENKVSKLYKDYLRRVDRADLIEELTRSKGAAFAGSEACRRCHQTAYAIWHGSAHTSALMDLEAQGHARDPDCLGCHVTGLASLAGFYSRGRTPNLANVTCESCHGPAKAHVSAPKAARLPKIGVKSCLNCHESENSPNFKFDAYWKKISHR